MIKIKLRHIKKASGQSLIEGLVALSLASIVIVAIIATVTASVATSRITGLKNRANQLVQDGMEIVRAQRSVAEGFYCVGEDETSLTSPVSPTSCDNEPNIDNTFVRSVEILDVSTECSSGVREVTVSVSWTDSQCSSGEFCQSASLRTCLTGGGVIAGNYPFGPTNTPTNTPSPTTIPTITPTRTPTPTLTPTSTPVPSPVVVYGSSNSGASVTSSSISWQATVGGGNRMLVVSVVTENQRTVTVTWDGNQSLTKLIENGTAGNQFGYIFYYVNPTNGTHTIQVNLNTSDNIRAGAIALSNVNFQTPFGTPVSQIVSSGTTITSPSMVSASNEIVLDLLAIANYNGSSTPNASQTEYWDTPSGGSSNPTGAGSYRYGASSLTTSWSWATSDRAMVIAVPVKPKLP